MKQKTMIRMMNPRTGLGRYIKRVATAISVTVNVILGGSNNQTFSARNHQWKRANLPNLVWLIDLTLGKGHCMQSWVYWKVRSQ